MIPWLAYPAVVTAVFLLFVLLQAVGMPLAVSTFAPVFLAAGLVAWLEHHFPHRLEWRPPASEVKTDLAFITVVQLAVPPFVKFLFAYLLLGPVSSLNLPTTALWPHGLPIWMQAILMILVVDLLRYWLHRAAHHNPTLWRFHAVHHSVERLYWLNTARFHPVEKFLQLCLDSLPFLLMGVDARVLALYYIAYATNGFFQHCNIRLRYGVLNYIVGSAETHRWHHSRLPRESNSNYGNTVIVWDLLFGTWYLPSDREIEDLGLQERDYPRTFVELMRAPFRR